MSSILQKKEQNIEQKRKIYKDGLMAYGFLTLLFLLDFNQKCEEFEECQIIYDVLIEHYKQFNEDLPTQFNEEAFIKAKKAFEKFGLTGDIMISNLLFYAIEVETKIQKLTLDC
jgi:hypothetical protein